MAAHLFNESGQMQEVEIPDIFDVLEGGEDENAVKFLLGFGGDETGVMDPDDVIMADDISSSSGGPLGSDLAGASGSDTSINQNEVMGSVVDIQRRRELAAANAIGGGKAVYSCDSCGKAFTTKFNLKRHINMHCHRSRELGVPLQGPPSASQPSRKTPKTIQQTLQPSAVVAPKVIPPTSIVKLITTNQNTVIPSSTYQTTKPVTVVTATPKLQPLPEAALQMLQTSSEAAPTQRIVRVITQPAHAAPISSIQLPQQPVPLIQTIKTHHPVVTNPVVTTQPAVITQPVVTTHAPPAVTQPIPTMASVTIHVNTTNQQQQQQLSQMAANISSIMPNIAATAVTAQICSMNNNNNNNHSNNNSFITIPSTTAIHNPEHELSTLPAELFDTDSWHSATPTPDHLAHAVKTSKSPTLSEEVLPPDQFMEFEFKKEIVDSPPTSEFEVEIPELKFLETIPPGWIRKVVSDTRFAFRDSRYVPRRVLYFNQNGKKFANFDEVDQYFGRLGYSVAQDLFNFDVPKMFEEEDDDSDLTSLVQVMPPKRRLSAVSGQDEDPSGDERRSETPEPGRKRKKLDPQQQMQALFDFVRKYKKDDGTELCEAFIRCPKRRSEPSYYDVVETPMDLLRIQQKLKTDEYNNMEELQADFSLIISNSKAYFKKDSQEYKDALELDDLWGRAHAKIELGEDPADSLGIRQESEEGELIEMLEDLFAAVMTAMDPTDPARALNSAFRLLPSAKRYPEYYKVITEPIDLKTIATKIRDVDYTNLTELEDDLLLMVKNAQAFNEPGSQIYRDSRMLQKIIKSKKFELDANKVARENRGATRTRRSIGKQHFSSEIAELQYEDSESEESEEDDIDSDDPLWMLYNNVRYHQTPSGVSLAEPFLRLPSKRELPDYYETIVEPISLNMIRRKLKQGEYAQLVDLADDLNTMFENCKTYNRPDSRLYKEGVKLQKLMNAKLEELEAAEDEEEEIMNAGGEKIKSPQSPAKRKMRILYNCLLNYRNDDGVSLIGMFMVKPSKKDYPDYYEVITTPMDMETINEKIKTGAYKSEDEMLRDCKLMFSNCRQYNEEGSEIYVDANILEKVLMRKAKELGIVGGGQRGKKKNLNLPQKFKVLFETLRDYKDPKGRQLSLIFLKLPNAKEFADYYEVIKRPIDFGKISLRIKQNIYVHLEECLADFILLFDNACKYNEPDSQIYKDALMLQSIAHKTCRQLLDEDEDSVPAVQAAVQELLNSIFIAMYNHQDSEERCYSDSMAELPEYNDIDGKQVRALNLDLIKRRLDRGLYKRLDTFQRDVFAVLERARNLSRTDSQVFEDSVELQTQFIKIRDEYCGNGDVLQSKALLYTQDDLMKTVNALKASKATTEQPDEDTMDGSTMHGNSTTASATFNEQQYYVGDFVYVESSSPERRGTEPLIFLIERIFTNADGEAMLYGNQFYRPTETFHVPTRKFLENEVFRTEIHDKVSFKQLVGKCWVMSVKDYFRSKPANFEDKDIYVCESRYQVKARSFKKLKQYWSVPEHITIVGRAEPLEMKRVMSVFKERIEKHKEEIEELEQLEKNVEEDLPPNVVWSCPNDTSQEGSVFYEQFTIPGPITLRRGDCVYVRSENGKNLIAQIDTMWTAADGMAYFNGPWFVTPSETTHPPTQMFYKQEVFLSTIADTNPLLSVVGKCCVLEMPDYIKSRPTQFTENDVFICESVYDESKRLVRGPLPNGLKQYEHAVGVQADEVYFFKKPIVIQKEPSPLYSKASMEVDNEDSMDAPSIISDAGSFSTPTHKKIRPGKKVVTAYILFSSEVRRITTEENKSCSFGEISRIVGDKWRQLSDAEKQVYEERARKLNEENARKFAEEERAADERRRHDSTPTHNGVQAIPPKGSQTPRATNSVSPGPQSRPPSQTPMMKPVEPIFHTVPPRPQRLLHSEAYIRYIEGLSADSQTMSNWEKQLNATKENTRTDEAKLPAHWLSDNGDHGTSLDALWALRDFMMCDTLGLTKLM